MTYFVVAHLHYVLIGGMVFPLFAALYYWMPHFTGRMMSERIGAWVFWLMFIGFNTTFFLMDVTGLQGMPRRISTYPENIGWDRLNMLSTIGSYILATGILLFVFDALRHRTHGRPAGHNPWNAATLEWLYPPHAPGFNFHAIPPVRSREPLWDQPELQGHSGKDVEGLLRGATHNRRETVGCDPVTGMPLQVLRLPHPTWTPMLTAFGLAVAFGALIASAYVVTAIGAAIFLLGVIAWAWEPSGGIVVDACMGIDLPINVVDRLSHLHFAVIGTLLVLWALFSSVLFAVFYLWNIRPDIAAAVAHPNAVATWIALASALGMGLSATITNRLSQRGLRFGAAFFGFVTATTAVVAAGGLVLALLPVDPRATELGATVWSLAGFAIVNLSVVAFWGLFNAARKVAGAVGPGQTLPDMNLASFARGIAAMLLAVAVLFLLSAMGVV